MTRRFSDEAAALALAAALKLPHAPRGRQARTRDERLAEVAMAVEIAEALLNRKRMSAKARTWFGGGLLRALESGDDLWRCLNLAAPRGSHDTIDALYRELKSSHRR